MRRQVAICAVAKEGRADAVGPPRGEVPVDLMGRACVGVNGARVRGRCPNRFLVYRYASVFDVRKSRKVGHVSHVCGAEAYRSS